MNQRFGLLGFVELLELSGHRVIESLREGVNALGGPGLDGFFLLDR